MGKTKAIQALLSAHPGVELPAGRSEAEIEFEHGGRIRRVWAGRTDLPNFGLVELMDNNPLVCADEISIPNAEATLALIAVGPLLRAGILAERPAAVFSFEPDPESVEAAFRSMGWREGSSIAVERQDLRSVLAVTAMCPLLGVQDGELVDSLYDGIYGASFFVRRAPVEVPWDIELVERKPWAAYRTSYAAESDSGLLSVRVMADEDGKCGAAQAVHAMNVMCGFEESLGCLETER